MTTVSLPVVLMGVLLTILDFFIVNVALPSLQTELGTDPAGLQLIIASYALALAATLVTGGRLGDLFGRRRMYFTGMGLFTLASAACGLAPSSGFLLASRVVQGLSAALMTPQVLAMISTAFTGAARARAFTAYGVVMGLAAVFGQLAGGLLIGWNPFGWGWRTCFLINLPIGIATIVWGWRHVPESKAPGRPRFDFGGVALLTTALLAVVVPLVLGRQQHWPWWSWTLLAAAAVLFPLFFLYELRLKTRGGSPLVDPALWRERAFSAGLSAQTAFFLGQASYFLVLALFLQNGLGLSALQAGSAFGVLGAGYLLTSSLAPRVAARWGRQTIALGGALRVAGLAVQAAGVACQGAGAFALVLAGMLLDGAGQGFGLAPLTSMILTRIPPAHAGAASGVLSTNVQVANALGIALLGLLFYPPVSAVGGPQGYILGFPPALLLAAGCEAALVVLVQLLPAKRAFGD